MASSLNGLVAKAQGKTAAIDARMEAQSAWVKYRDSQLRAEWPNPDVGQYDTVYPMCVLIERTRLTKTRVAELQSMIKGSEGDVCGPQWPSNLAMLPSCLRITRLEETWLKR